MMLHLKDGLSNLLFLILLGASMAAAQDNYEIQVYPSETVAPGTTMFEIHSNFTAQGSKTAADGVQPSNHAEHETLEITHGFNDWFETGFYVFSSIQPNGGWQWVGDHIRPRVRVPTSWKWPVGVSLSSEIGYVRRSFSKDTWTWELRPIVDKQLGKWYLAFNPALEGTIHGVDAGTAPGFAPAGKVGYDFTKKISGGFEYYGSMGPLTGFDSFSQQQQQFFPTIDLNLSPEWEFNFGVGVGTTRSTDHLIVKMILGRRFSWGHRPRMKEGPGANPPGPARKY
jgi:hypothetical protein